VKVKENLLKVRVKDTELEDSEEREEKERERVRDAEREQEELRIKILEVEEEIAKWRTRAERSGIILSADVFTKVSRVLAEAETAVAAGNYEETKKFIELAEESLEDLKETVENSEAEKEEQEGQQSDNKTGEDTPAALR
jgi:hypothetical protein